MLRFLKSEKLMKICTEVAGNVWKILVSPGQVVASGDVLAIIESMKMEIPVEAPKAGTISAVLTQEGVAIAEGAGVVELV